MIEKMIAVDKINKLFASAPGAKNTAFTDACLKYLDVTCRVVGEENLPSADAKYIFASNHPQGGIEAICIASVLGRKYGDSIKFYANEILCYLEPLTELFVPIKRKQKNKANVHAINDFYKTDNHIIVFPAGVTASKKKGKIIDHEWHKSFITKAIQNQRDVIPLYFQAQNSDLFYIIENFRRFIRSRINFDVILFGHEFFKQRGKTLTLYIGKPVSWETFDKTKTPKEWADSMKEIVCGLPE
jgi:putative hemolysin